MPNDPQVTEAFTWSGLPTRADEDLAYLLLFMGSKASVLALPQNGTIEIGRGESSTLVIDDTMASRRHAVIDVVDGRAIIRDLGSQNGSFLNGERLCEDRALISGDVVTIGASRLVFQRRPRASCEPMTVTFAQFQARAEHEIERALTFERPLSILVVLFDKPWETALRGSSFEPFKGSDLVARGTSKDQLLAILPETDVTEAKAIAERFVERCAPAVAARIGTAGCPEDGSSIDTLIAGARVAAESAAPNTVRSATGAHATIRAGAATIVYAEPATAQLFDLVRRIAASNIPVLVHGETGCGKEMVALALHHWSQRSDGPCITLNCAALPESLVESELFGHEKGAFSGAVGSKVGLLEAASGGTMFLDEIGELALPIQAKLLRAIDTKRITRVGDTKEREVDIRIVGATNRDLESECRNGRFREDLYFRLCGGVVWIPPLRDRPQDLLVLARMFLDRACKENGRHHMELSNNTLRMLRSHQWPGNIRELKLTMEYVAAVSSDPIVEPRHIAARLQKDAAALDDRIQDDEIETEEAHAPRFRPIDEELRELEKRRIKEALEAAGGHQKLAAELISMPLRTFATKMKLYGLVNLPAEIKARK